MKITQSMLTLYSFCPLLYKYIYIDKKQFSKTDSLIIGEVVHDVIKQIEQQNIYKEREIWRTTLRSVIKHIDFEDRNRLKNIYYTSLGLLREYLKSRPKQPPLAVEFPFVLSYKKHTISGRFDRVEKNGIGQIVVNIIDVKTGKFVGRSYKALQESFQSVIYAWAGEQIYGVRPFVRYWWLLWGKQITLEIPDDVIDCVFRKIMRIISRITRGVFEPRVSSYCEVCSAYSYCVYGQKYSVEKVIKQSQRKQYVFSFV